MSNRTNQKHTIRRRTEASVGLTPVLTPDNAPLRELSVSRLRIDARHGDYSGSTQGRETLLHILVGSCTIEASGPWGARKMEKLGERRDVFSGCPTSVLLGGDSDYTIVPLSDFLDIAVVSVPAVSQTLDVPTVIRPQDVKSHDIGEKHYFRLVREVLGGEGPAFRLRAGETINPVGKWSSWPHHDFDANPELAPAFEEVFLYFTKPGNGWGIQKRTGLCCDLQQLDDVFVVRNGDAAIMPLGDHPLVAGVESDVMYIWFYISPIPKIYAKWAEDVGGYA